MSNLGNAGFNKLVLYIAGLGGKLEIKELSLCHKLENSIPIIFATWRCKPEIFQT